MVNEVHVPDICQCTVKEWGVGDEYECLPKRGELFLRLNVAEASNESELRQHDYLLVNARTGKILFSTPVQPKDFIRALYDEVYNAGYSSGHNDGYSVGKKERIHNDFS